MNQFLDYLTSDTVPLFGAFLLAVAVLGGIGYGCGSTKGRGPLGFLLGFLLGPLGWIIVLLLPHQDADQATYQCPECTGRVPTIARKCMHCGSDLRS